MMTTTENSSREDLFVLAHRFRQGGRDVYACVLDLSTLDARLPDRVDDRVVKRCQSAAHPVPCPTDPSLLD